MSESHLVLPILRYDRPTTCRLGCLGARCNPTPSARPFIIRPGDAGVVRAGRSRPQDGGLRTDYFVRDSNIILRAEGNTAVAEHSGTCPPAGTCRAPRSEQFRGRQGARPGRSRYTCTTAAHEAGRRKDMRPWRPWRAWRAWGASQTCPGWKLRAPTIRKAVVMVQAAMPLCTYPTFNSTSSSRARGRRA